MKTLLLTIVAFILMMGISVAQVTVTGSVGADGTYPSLTTSTGAFASINGAAQTGASIIITVTTDVSIEDGVTSLNAGAWTTLKIFPGGGVARTISGNLTSGNLLNLNGADNVTIDGLNTGGN